MKKKKILFIDRDGTLVHETEDEKVDDVSKLTFLNDCLKYLRKIREETDYLLVMVTNQDGLGTDDLPNDRFWPVHHCILRILKSENILFDAIHIDEHYPSDNHPNRKPGIGMLTGYLGDEFDLINSYVIGDRVTDVEMANRLGTKSIHISSVDNTNATLTTLHWKEIYEHLVYPFRTSTFHRKTIETDIFISLNLDGSGKSEITTGIGFFDHMLEQIAKHSGIDIKILAKGDLHIDEHHTIEDVGIAFGQCFLQALGDKKGISRYGFSLPMDDAHASISIDFGGRQWIIWDVKFTRERVGEMPTEMVFHFFKSFSDEAKCNLHINATGENDHHKIEAIFKSFARAIKMAVKREGNQLPTTKGIL